MATIRQRRQANGSIRYTAIVRLRKGRLLLHQEYKTFSHLAAAHSWARPREVELESPATLLRKQHAAVTVRELIRWHIDSFQSISKWQRPKQDNKGGQMHDLAIWIMDSQYFMGREFSWGDGELVRCALKQLRGKKVFKRNQCDWIAIDTNHHLTWVVQ